MAEGVPSDRSSNSWDISEASARFSNDPLFGDGPYSQSRSSDLKHVDDVPFEQSRYSDLQYSEEDSIIASRHSNNQIHDAAQEARFSDVPTGDESRSSLVNVLD